MYEVWTAIQVVLDTLDKVSGLVFGWLAYRLTRQKPEGK
jgi:hypothetical protein